MKIKKVDYNECVVNDDDTIPVKSWQLSDFLHQVPATEFDPEGAHSWSRESRDKEWDGGISSPQALELAKIGDSKLAAKAALDIERYQIETLVQTGFKTTMGFQGTPSIGAYLAGRPDCMRSRSRVEVQARHVNIYVGTVCSASITAESMLKRGAIILGLLETLRSMQIAVDVYVLAEMGRLAVIEIPSHPLDLSVSGFALAHPAFTRNLIYPMLKKEFYSPNFHVDWTPEKRQAFYKDQGSGSYTNEYLALVRKSLHAGPNDIIIPGPMSYHDSVLADPKAWLEKNIQQITQGTGA